jgi:hypothetical protein
MCGSPGSVLAQNPAPPVTNAAPVLLVGPRIEFATPVHDFGKITSGIVVNHDFVFTNTGDAVLEVSYVRAAGGGPSDLQWDKFVAPGQTGRIPVQIRSAKYRPGPVRESVTVFCNDTNHRATMLQFKGMVWRPIEVKPAYVQFTPLADAQTNETAAVCIVNNTDEPLTLSAPECGTPSFKAELKTVKEGKEFELLISHVPPFSEANVAPASITLKTSSQQEPIISVRAFVVLKHAVEVIPSQFVLGPPATNVTKLVATVRNNDTDVLVLSEPKANVPGVQVEVQATVPGGGQFYLAVNFPAGFTVQRGQPVEVSVKTSHPKFPIIRVPVLQLPARPPSAGPALKPR